MIIRERFEQALNGLRDGILKMGDMVQSQLLLALEALDALDVQKARDVQMGDVAVNQARFRIEEECTTLIVTQQPTARDLRVIISAMNIIVDLERMGDQAKGIAKAIPHLLNNPDQPRPAELKEMGRMAARMAEQTMSAYARDNEDLAGMVCRQDDDLDRLYARVFAQIMSQMAEAGQPDRVEAAYEILRVARELERFGDLATNIAERVIYLKTGQMRETNLDFADSAEAPRGDEGDRETGEPGNQ